MAFFRASIGGGGSGMQCAEGTFTMTTSAQNIDIGFQPKYLAVCFNTTSKVQGYIYNSDVSTSKYLTVATGSAAGWANLNTGSVRLKSIDNNGFTTLCSGGYNGTYRYFAIG